MPGITLAKTIRLLLVLSINQPINSILVSDMDLLPYKD